MYILLFAVAFRPRKPFLEEKTYRTLAEDGKPTRPQQLPCWQDNWERQRRQAPHKPTKGSDVDIEKPELFMSVVVPAYNEEERLVGMLEETVDYLEHTYGTLAGQTSGTEKQGETKKKNDDVRQRKQPNNNNNSNDSSKGWEILIVSDGSTDRTEDIAFEFARDHRLSLHPEAHAGSRSPATHRGAHIPPGSIRIVTLTQNRGKGGAVTHGMRHVRGQYVVFADADGASKFADLGKLVTACQQVEDSEGRAVAVGSRAHMVGSEAVVKVISLPFFFFSCLCLQNRTNIYINTALQTP